MKKTKHFNISVPELGDVPDITQVSNAISDLEDATAGTLEIMKAEMQGTKITLTSVSRKTKRTGYYEGMSIRFKSPQDIEPNYLKTISIDDLSDQVLSVAYKVNRNEYIDIVYEGNKFTAYPVVVQKTDSVSNNSSILVGTAKAVKTVYDKGVEALNKANQAQSSANKAQSTADGKVSKSGDTMTGALRIASGDSQLYLYKSTMLLGKLAAGESGVYLHNSISDRTIALKNDGGAVYPANNLKTSSKEVVSAINELNNGKEPAFSKKSGFNLDKTDSFTNDTNKLFTAKGAYNLKNEIDTKVSKSGDTINGALRINSDNSQLYLYKSTMLLGKLAAGESGVYLHNSISGKSIILGSDGDAAYPANNLKTKSKEVVAAINEVNNNVNTKLSKDDFAGNPILWSGSSYNVTVTLPGDVQSLDDVLYIQVFGANDSACIDGNFLKALSNGEQLLLGYVQGTKNDQVLRIVKIDNRNFRFEVEGSGHTTDGSDQTYKIKYVVLRRI